MEDFVVTFGLLVIVITLISFFVKLLRQPIIIGYVLSGLAFAQVYSSDLVVSEQLALFAEIGVTFLLFLTGLEFDLSSLKYLGRDILVSTFWQSLAFFGAGFGLTYALGFGVTEAVYMGIFFMFSSTLLAAKWVDDKKDTGSLQGKITLSTLIMQDIIAIAVLTFLNFLKQAESGNLLLVPIYGVSLAVIAFLFSRYLLNAPLKYASRYPELLFISSLSVCFLFVFLAYEMGYSTVIGAFIGGVVLANTQYKSDILTRLRPLINFFNMLFFVGLGFQMVFHPSWSIIGLIVGMVLLSLTLKPVIIFLSLRVRGIDMKSSFLTGTYLSQLSEFGIRIIGGAILVAGLVEEFRSVAIISVIGSMIFSSYIIKYDRKIYAFLKGGLRRFDKRFLTREVKTGDDHYKANIVFFGYYDLAKGLRSKLESMGKKILVVENDPENVSLLRKEGIRFVYNSVNNPDFFEHAHFDNVEMVVSNLADSDENRVIIKEIKKSNPSAVLIVSARSLKESLELYKLGADYVMYAQYLKEQRVCVLLEEYATDMSKIIAKKVEELENLNERQARMQASRGDFYDVEKFLNRIKHPLRRKKKDDVAVLDQAREEKSEELFEYLGLGEKYL